MPYLTRSRRACILHLAVASLGSGMAFTLLAKAMFFVRSRLSLLCWRLQALAVRKGSAVSRSTSAELQLELMLRARFLLPPGLPQSGVLSFAAASAGGEVARVAVEGEGTSGGQSLYWLFVIRL